MGEPWIYTYDVARRRSPGADDGGHDREREVEMEDEVIRTVVRAAGTEIQPL